MGRLEHVDLDLKLDKDEYEERLSAAQDRLTMLRLQLAGLIGEKKIGPPVCAVFEGWDASGKGGAIKRLVEELDHRHVRVAAFAAPTHDEKRHHFLWRFWPKLPGWGGVAVLDRSWYGRVLVERVEGFATVEEWRRSYREIAEFERMLANDGMVLIKFYVHISDEEQLRRFESRRDDPVKAWKLTDDDWKNRSKRPQYLEAVEEMLLHTDHVPAPWHLVEGDSKRYARVKVVETAADRIEAGMRAAGIEPPPVSG